MQHVKRIAAFVADLSRELVGLAGVGSFSYGAWLAWHPLGYMVAGLLLIGFAILLGKGAK